MDSILLSKGLGPEIPWTLSSDKINDKRKMDKFSNDILSTQRETWSNWEMIRDNQWVSFNTRTSRLYKHMHNSTQEDQERELAIFSITVEVQCLSGTFAFARQKKSPE